MSRTYRRKGQRHLYDWVLCDWNADLRQETRIDPRSKDGRRALARFHSDKPAILRGSAPRWYRRIYKRRLRTFNDRMLRRCLADPDFDPVFVPRHRNSATWAWW